MSDNGTFDWALPVSFYFLVEFQRGGEHFQASFMEVSGLGMQINTKNHLVNEGIWQKVPDTMAHGNITLKRLLIPLKASDSFTNWVKSFLEGDRPRQTPPYDMIIKLLDKEGSPLIGWHCTCTFPVQWTTSKLDAEKSELATETVVLAINRIRYIL